jgi:hypothetical protein
MFDAICLLCKRPRSEHQNGAVGKNIKMNEDFPRFRCPPDFKQGGSIVGYGQFAVIVRVHNGISL